MLIRVIIRIYVVLFLEDYQMTYSRAYAMTTNTMAHSFEMPKMIM